MITASQLALCTNARVAVGGQWLAPIQAVMNRYRINTPKRIAAFLAQIGHESAGLSSVRENLNYTPEALLATFNTSKVARFTKEQANRFGRTVDHLADQISIANVAYASRMGNGDVASGDGWRFRGGGPGQLTGRDNYSRCGKTIGIDLVGNPILIERPDVGSMAFGWFWNAGNPTGRDLNPVADTGDIDAVSRAINGGDHGLIERRVLYAKAIVILGGTHV